MKPDHPGIDLLGGLLARPVVLLTGAVVVGILLDRSLEPSPWLLLGGAGLVLAGALLVRVSSSRLLPLLLLLLLAAALLAGASHGIDLRAPRPADHLLHREGEQVTLLGRLRQGPWMGQQNSYRYLLAAEWLRVEAGQPWEPVQGAVQLGLAGPPPVPLLAGDRVLVRSQLRRPRGYGNPGSADFAALLAVRGAQATMFLREPTAVVLLERGHGFFHQLARIRERVNQVIEAEVADPAARELVRGLALGDAGAIPLEVRDAMAATGTAHLIALSGGNLALVALVVHGLLSWLFRRHTGLLLHLTAPRWIAAGSILAVVCYTLLTGAQIPTTRAMLMAVVYLGAPLFGRDRDLATAFSLSALLLLLGNPASLFDPSFQLSFFAVAALLLFTPPLLQPCTRWRPPPGCPWWRPARLRWLICEAVAVALAAWVGTSPVIAFHFQQLSLISPLANLIVVPLVSLLLFPLAASLLVLAPLHPLVAAPVAWLAGQLGIATALLNVALARLPGAGLPVAAPGALGYLALLLALLLLFVSRTPRGRWAGGALGLVALGAWGWPGLAAHFDRGVTAQFLDVGQGDSTHLQLPGPFQVLIDTGGSEQPTPELAALALVPPLRQAWVRRIDLLVLTHPHPDHYGGAMGVLAEFEVGRVWLPAGHDAGEHAPRWRELLAELQRRGIPVERVDRSTPPLRCGAAELRVLHPPPGSPELSGNDRSIVLSLRLGDQRLLLAGDLEHPGARILLAAFSGPAELHHDLIKVPHHGSRTASGPELLDAVRPAVAVFSLGYRNRYDFPHQSVWEDYGRRGVRRLRLDETGAVLVRLTGQGPLHVTRWRRTP